MSAEEQEKGGLRPLGVRAESSSGASGDRSRKCVYCGDPVHAKSWFSVLRRHCLLRALGLDCAAHKGLNPSKGGSSGSAEPLSPEGSPNPRSAA